MDLTKYPRTKRFLEQHPEMSIDDALLWAKKQLEGDADEI